MVTSVKGGKIESPYGDLYVTTPVVYADNEARFRSGHMTHAMTEFAPGKVLDFNSNCSPYRSAGHSAFGYIEYRISEDGGSTFGDIRVMQPSMDVLLAGVYSFSVEKAVTAANGDIVAIAHRNTQKREICCEPWDTPLVYISRDAGDSWECAGELSQYKGRTYAMINAGDAILALEFANDAEDTFTGTLPEHQYHLLRSDDCGAHFTDAGVVPFPDTRGRGYGALVLAPDGRLIAYAYNADDPVNMDYAVSTDLGGTWTQTGKCFLDKGIRNPQIGILEGEFILHGRLHGTPREWGKGFGIYTSADGLEWTPCHVMETEKGSCYYSNNLVVDDPARPGRKRMLVQFSEVYEKSRVNAMHMWITKE